MKKRTTCRMAGLLAILAGLQLLTGCGTTLLAAEKSDTESQKETAALQSAGSDAAEKTLVIGSGQACATLDPANAYDGWYTVRYGISETLTKMNDDMTISGWLITDDYTASEDYTTWTFHIWEGIIFSNGDVVDAAAVKASLERVFAESNRGTDYFTPVQITADGQTLTITCDRPEPILPNKLADPLFVVIDTAADLSDIQDKGPVGCGPFVVESFDPVKKECVVVRNATYYGGEVKADRIDFVYTEDQSALTMGLLAGDFDAVYNVSMSDIASFETAGYTIERTASGRTTHGFMNQKGALQDKVLREALLRCIDKETICNVQLNGQYVAGKTLVTSSAPYGYETLNDPYPYDPQKAVELLDAAGYRDVDGEGYRETPKGEPLSLDFVYYQGRPEQEIVVTATQIAAEQELGIRINAVVNDTQTVIDRLAAGEYDLLCMSINVLNCADPENHLNTYFQTGGSYASFGWSNTAFDGILDSLTATADPTERIGLVMQAEQILLDDAVYISYCYPLMNFVMKDNVTGITSTPADYYWVSAATDIQR